MEHDNILTATIRKLLSEGRPSGDRPLLISNFHFSALYALIQQIDGPSVIFSDEDDLTTLLEIIQPKWELNRGLFFPRQDSSDSTPSGFQSLVLKHRQTTASVLRSFVENISFILTTERAAREPFFTNLKNQPYTINDKADYNSLNTWLKNSLYTRSDIVSTPGTYAVRGGIIDIFPITSQFPTRINFTEDSPQLFIFDVDTQLTLRQIKSLILVNKAEGAGNIPLLDIINGSFTEIYVPDGSTVLVGGKKPSSRRNFPLYPVDFNSYLKNKYGPCSVSDHLVNTGFIDKTGNIVVPPWFIGSHPRRVIEPETSHQRPREIVLEDLQVGDFLAHRDHGVGIYRGLKRDALEGNVDEFLILEYKDNSLIYVSKEMFRRISFYASKNEQGIVPDSLNKKALWSRKKARARRQAEAAVSFLVDLYAQESSQKRPPYSVEPEVERILLSKFNYEDTADQKVSWNDISSDLSGSTPMNRLLCGDVGFGKTEIAIRAAFRVAYSGKMVVVLAPTTILANQLYSAFDARLREFSITVDVISRFRSKIEINEIKSKIERGIVDVIVGTHALLSDDIVYNNIGLLIIDEEHRFGVAQKEKLKSLKNSIDVLYMSATPIPRTLHMALTGIRNISTLFTPPKTRLPINTQISYYDIDLIKRAISFEIKRGGQVFFVHNNISSLPEIADKIQSILPDTVVDFAHGQLSPHKLENTMVRFIQGDIQVLVTTSIIETGIDIQNANTIIINRAHLFGLSQLYQIRGRVGRGNRLAYAYLLIPRKLQLSQDAYKRLKSIEENTSLGSGYNISKNDLEIRGAGTLFGFKQSGGSSGVGFELYSQFINEAIQKQTSRNKTDHIGKIHHVSVKLFADTTIPIDYIKTTNLRLSFYKRLSLANYISEVNQIEYEMLNRFGPAPQSVSHLFATTRIRILGAKTSLGKVVFRHQTIILDFEPFPISLKLDHFFELTHKYFLYAESKHWFKKRGEHALSLVITPVSLEDITSLVLGFLNKLQNVF